MPNDEKKTAFPKSRFKIHIHFLIPYVLLSIFFITLLCFSQFSFLRVVSIITIILITPFVKNKILNKKHIFDILFWVMFITVAVSAFIFTKPPLKDRIITTSENKIYTSAVETQYGLISGVYNSDKSVELFAGIPYAAPPVDNLRWKAPQEPQKWDGVRKSDHFSDCAVQNKVPTFFSKLLSLSLGSDILTNVSIEDSEKISEDCLYLNIWTSSKATAEKRPVIVYIHGGSFTSGSGSMDIYNGESMAKKGAVFVTINYRLGIFGFMASPELTKESEYSASGNYGILDQIAALKWVKNNISAFGGDPDNITLAGESAGSMSVNILQASPLAKQLFQRVIGESGANFGSRGIKGDAMQTLDSAEQSGTEFAKTFKNSSLTNLRKISASDLLKASKNISTRPIVDGYVLPDTIYNIYASGQEIDVPALIGYNANESTIFLTLPFPFNLFPDYSTLSATEFTTRVNQTYGSKSSDFLKIFPACNDSQAKTSTLMSSTIQCFGWHMHTWAKLQSQSSKSKVYTYYFNHVQPGISKMRELGAFHGSEIAYAYGNLKKNDLPYTSADYKLSEIMSTYWFNFATSGNPNGTGLPKWDAFNNTKDQTLELDDDITMIATPNIDELSFFDQYEASLRSH